MHPPLPALATALLAPAVLSLATARGVAQPAETVEQTAVPQPAPAAPDRLEAGRAAFEAGRFVEAAEQFRAAYDETGSPEVAFNVGLSFDRAGNRTQAAVWYRVYLQGSPEAPDRDAVAARIAELEAPPVTDTTTGPEEPSPTPGHRIRLQPAYGYYLDGAVYERVPPEPVDLGGFHLELGYQLPLWRSLVLDALVGASFSLDAEASTRTWDVWSGCLGLAWIWTDLPYVVAGVRGNFGFYAMVPNVGDLHYLVPFRAGAWLELPLWNWLALHVGMDLGLGAYVARDDTIFGLLVEAGGGVTFVLGADDGEDEPQGETDRRPGRHGPPEDLGRGWQ